MSQPHSLSDDAAQVTESGLLFLDWTLLEKNPAENSHSFDGKIIARMPDLGSECVAKNNEKPRFRSYWRGIGTSLASVMRGSAFPASAIRLQLFNRITAFGCTVILCGLVILLFGQGDKSTENAPDIAEIVAENVKIPIEIEKEKVMVLTPVVLPEPTEKIADVALPVAIPVAPAEHFGTAPVAATGQPDLVQSVWNRPASDSYSPWNVTQRQPESPSTEVASSQPPQSPPPVQSTLSNTVAMVPMVDLSMPVSPYEQQWMAQSNQPPVQALPVQAPVDPFMQVHNYAGPGAMPMQHQLMNAQEVAARPNGQRMPPPPYPQHLAPLATQGMPIQHQYEVPPPNVPIPSGISTLPAQSGGYYQQHPGVVPSSLPPNSGNYYNAPPTYRRVY